MERYQEYKDSGEQWLGEIPSHWETIPMRYILHPRKSIVGSNSYKYDLLSLTLMGIVKRDMDNPTGKFPSSFETYQIVQKGDFVFCLFDNEETPRTVGLSDLDGMITGAYDVMQLKSDKILPYYLNYYLIDIDNGKRLKPLYKGLRKTVPLDSFLSLKYPIPPLSEQTAMVSYLDRITAQIDKAIAQQQRMIDLLNERKQIIIQHAVTKGLAPNAEMVDSGVEWIGTIPKHWETIRLNYCSWIRARLGWKGLKADEYVSNGYPFLSAFNIVNNKMSWEKLNYINKFRFDESPEIKLQEGDILLVKDGAGIGKCARVDNLPYGEATANGSLAFITPNDKVFYKYLHYFIVSDSFGKYKELLITGMGVPHLTQGEIKKMRIPVPPIKEQVEISKYLDHHIDQIDDSIKIVEQRIILLRERRQIIINEVVTGKVKVS